MRKKIVIMVCLLLLATTFLIKFIVLDKDVMKLSSRKDDKALLSALGINEAFIYDISLTNKYTEFTSWSEHYYKGNLIDKVDNLKISNFKNQYIGKKSRLVVTSKSSADNPNELEYLVGLSNQENSFVGPKSFLKQNYGTAEFGFTMRNGTQVIKENEPIILAIQVQNLQKNNVESASISNEIFLNDAEEMAKLLKNDNVYIYYCKFNK